MRRRGELERIVSLALSGVMAAPLLCNPLSSRVSAQSASELCPEGTNRKEKEASAECRLNWYTSIPLQGTYETVYPVYVNSFLGGLTKRFLIGGIKVKIGYLDKKNQDVNLFISACELPGGLADHLNLDLEETYMAVVSPADVEIYDKYQTILVKDLNGDRVVKYDFENEHLADATEIATEIGKEAERITTKIFDIQLATANKAIFMFSKISRIATLQQIEAKYGINYPFPIKVEEVYVPGLYPTDGMHTILGREAQIGWKKRSNVHIANSPGRPCLIWICAKLSVTLEGIYPDHPLFWAQRRLAGAVAIDGQYIQKAINFDTP